MIHVASKNSTTTLTNVSEKDIQPNAVDLKLDKIFTLSDETFVIDEEQKIHRSKREVLHNTLGYWNLRPGFYEIVFENKVTVGHDEAGLVITRSTLNRNGVFITTGVFDSKYSGNMSAGLHITSGNMVIKKGTRVAQYVSFKSESLKEYDGDYGLGKSHDNVYTKP